MRSVRLALYFIFVGAKFNFVTEWFWNIDIRNLKVIFGEKMFMFYVGGEGGGCEAGFKLNFQEENDWI